MQSRKPAAGIDIGIFFWPGNHFSCGKIVKDGPG